MQTEYPHRNFYRLDAVRDELSPPATGRMIARLVRTGQAEPVAFYYGRTKPKRRCKFDRYAKRRRCGDRGRKPGQMVQIDHMSVAIEAGFSVKESEAVCPARSCAACAPARAPTPPAATSSTSPAPAS